MPRESDDIELTPGDDDVDRRLDKVLRRYFRDTPLSALYGQLRRGQIRVNGRRCTPDYRIAAGDTIEVVAALARALGAAELQAGPDDLDSLAPILVLATADLLFINKPAGEQVYGAGSIGERVKAALRGRSAASMSFSPGPLHRLDRNTSGLIVYSRSALGARVFSEAMRGRRVRKRYIALLKGEMDAEENWRDFLERDRTTGVSRVAPGTGGKLAISRARPLCTSGGLTLAVVEIETGLTHQIRVQAAAHGFPLLGDAKYGGGKLGEGYVLHAFSLEFSDEILPDIPRRVVAPLSPYALKRLTRMFPDAEAALNRASQA